MWLFLHCSIWWLSIGPCSGCEQQMDCFFGSGVVPSRFGDEIKQGEIVTGRPSGSVVQLEECSHGIREVLEDDKKNNMFLR